MDLDLGTVTKGTEREFNYLACRDIITTVTVGSEVWRPIDPDNEPGLFAFLPASRNVCLPAARFISAILCLVFSALPRKIPYRMFNNLHRLIGRAYRGEWRDKWCLEEQLVPWEGKQNLDTLRFKRVQRHGEKANKAREKMVPKSEAVKHRGKTGIFRFHRDL